MKRALWNSNGFGMCRAIVRVTFGIYSVELCATNCDKESHSRRDGPQLKRCQQRYLRFEVVCVVDVLSVLSSVEGRHAWKYVYAYQSMNIIYHKIYSRQNILVEVVLRSFGGVLLTTSFGDCPKIQTSLVYLSASGWVQRRHHHIPLCSKLQGRFYSRSNLKNKGSNNDFAISGAYRKQETTSNKSCQLISFLTLG